MMFYHTDEEHRITAIPGICNENTKQLGKIDWLYEVNN
jgi:hypothetical protein